ncbi:DUF7286 family protein [Natronomonas sp.]|uniref:DUF7286 family protein n=1 Tax=Natronomonas sp. TaxID=2184060 RepID=UPI0026186216|nr:hypothetical protein [Natronomonas sp.]
MNDRGRVPFALVGVLLLVTATTLSVSVVPGDRDRRPDIDRAMDGTTAAAVTELRGAADEAATAAAIDPVITPAATTAGEALSEDASYRDALRLRIYVRAAERLSGTETTRGRISVRASLPAVEPTTEGYRRAIKRVEIDRVGDDGTALRVEIDGVTLSATRDGRTVETAERSPTFVVANPALSLHDRTDRFERRATAPVTRKGLGRRLTARLYPIVWTRGYAQYGGAPIATVLGTRHVELATNDALLAEQRAVFGEADPDGHRGVAAAGRRVATTDLLVGAGGDEEWQDVVLRGADRIGPAPPADRPVGTWLDEPDDPTVTVGVNGSADHAFADLIGVTGDDELAEAIERTHTVEARVTASATLQSRIKRNGDSPGRDWTLVDERTSESTSVATAGGRTVGTAGWRTWDSETFEVVITETTVRTWEGENETMRTESVSERTYRVRTGVEARTEPIDGVPRGRLDGRLRQATDRATAQARSSAGGFRRVARAAAHGRPVRSMATATADPTFERRDVERDLYPIRDETRNVSVTLPATAVGTGRTNPARRLSEALPERDALLGSEDRSTPARTRRAAEIRYLDALETELNERESVGDSASDGIEGALGEYLDTDRLDGAMAAHRAATRPEPEPLTDPAGNLSFAVDTAPSYLTTSELSRDRIDSRGDGTIHPLATRTVNVFTSPHGDVASGLFDRLPVLGTQRVPLSTAARTLSAAEGSERGRLEATVEPAVTFVRGELFAELIDAGVSEREARRLLSPEASTAEEALMLTNGTTVERATGAETATVTTDRLELRLRTTLDTALEADSARPRRAPTTDTQDRIREEYGEELQDTVEKGLETKSERVRKRALGKRLGSLPAGLPLAPVPGYWYATTNVWYVNVTGTYERFAVRADRGDASGSVTYLRDGRAAAVTHRGAERHLGTADRVSVRTRTAVVVVVPPGPRGVGNTDGTMIQDSSGWPG